MVNVVSFDDGLRLLNGNPLCIALQRVGVCSNWNYRRVFWITAAFLLCCGDVEPNPGPNYKHPCTVCSHPVKCNQRGIQCSWCEKWTHAKCCGVSTTEYDHLTTLDDDWLCPRCPLSELPFFHTDSIHHHSSNKESLEISESVITFRDIPDLEPTYSNSLLNIPSSNSFITIAHLNIRSILPKIDILRDSLAVSSSTKPVTILTLSETWLNNDINDCQITIQGYDLFRKDRVAHGGGVVAYVPNHLKVHRRPDLETNDVDMLWLELRLRSRRILIGVTYRPPNDIDFFTHFDNISSRACLETNKSLILIGDFNCNTLAPNSQNSKLLFATTNELRLTQLVADPTRITENSRTIIDLIFSSDQLNASGATVTPCSLSDHHIVSCQVNIKPPRPPQRFVHSRLLHKCDTEALKNDFEMVPWQVSEIFDDIDDQVNFWESLYLRVLDHHAPKRRFRVRAKSLPWIDDDLRNLMRYRDWLHRRAIRENSSINWDSYKSARNKVTSDLRRAKKPTTIGYVPPTFILLNYGNNSTIFYAERTIVQLSRW